MNTLSSLQARRSTLAARLPWFEGALMAVSATLLFLASSMLFFALLGRSPLPLLLELGRGAFGSSYGISETLVKTTPILLCALATALPARLGLLTVGASGQLYLGAWCGTALFLTGNAQGLWIPGLTIFVAACLGGALWSLIPGFLKAHLEVNETLSTLLLNYIAALLVDWAVYGPWRDPANLGWPATTAFSASAKVPLLIEGSRLHAGLLLAVIMGALMSAADALQLFAQLPEATATVLQALLFISVLVAGGLLSRGRS